MTNTLLLEEYIKNSGLKRSKLASYLGITLAGLKKKTTGQREFKASEIQILCNLLGIESADENDRIFFALKVE